MRSALKSSPDSELHGCLLQLNSPARPWLIRDGVPEGVDLVAEWKSGDPDWRQVLEDLAVALTFQIHLRLDADNRLRPNAMARAMAPSRCQVHGWGP